MNHHRARRHPAVLFAAVCKYHFRLPMLAALRWWEAMAGSQHPQVAWTLRKLSGYHGRVEAFVAWGWRTLPPRTLIESVEHLHEEGGLTRLEATQIEESILAIVAEAGSWRPRTGQCEKLRK